MTDDNNGYDIEQAILGAILIDPAATEFADQIAKLRNQVEL